MKRIAGHAAIGLEEHEQQLVLDPNLLEHALRMTTMTTAASYGKISDEELELASMDDVATAAEPGPAHGAASSAAARDAGDASDALAPFRHRDYRCLLYTCPSPRD